MPRKSVEVPPLVSPDLNQQRWLTISEAAVYSRRCDQTIYGWIHDGLLRVSKPDAQYLIDRHVLDEFLVRHEKVVAPYRRGTHEWVTKRHAEARKAASR